MLGKNLIKAWNFVVGKKITLKYGAKIVTTSSQGAETEIVITDIEKIDGITNGTVTASKAVVVDASKDIAGFHNVSATGGLAGWGAALSTSQIAALSTFGAVTLSTANVANLSTAQISALVTNNDLIVSALRKIGVAP